MRTPARRRRKKSVDDAVTHEDEPERDEEERVQNDEPPHAMPLVRREPMDESHPLQGQSPYAASKIGADKLAESYYRSFGTPVVTLRRSSGMLYGPPRRTPR